MLSQLKRRSSSDVKEKKRVNEVKGEKMMFCDGSDEGEDRRGAVAVAVSGRGHCGGSDDNTGCD